MVPVSIRFFFLDDPVCKLSFLFSDVPVLLFSRCSCFQCPCFPVFILTCFFLMFSALFLFSVVHIFRCSCFPLSLLSDVPVFLCLYVQMFPFSFVSTFICSCFLVFPFLDVPDFQCSSFSVPAV